jgi:hypothetical protein
MNKARPVKYIRKVSDGKGGYRYYYKESDNRNLEIITEFKMKQFINFILNAKEEHVLCINDKNEKILYREGDKGRVLLTKRQRRLIKNMPLLIHNHTNGSSFSPFDIKILLEQHIKELQIYTKINNKENKYSLYLLKNIEDEETQKEILDSWRNIAKEIYIETYRKVLNEEINGNEASISFAHLVMIEFTNKYKDIFKYEKQRLVR